MLTSNFLLKMFQTCSNLKLDVKQTKGYLKKYMNKTKVDVMTPLILSARLLGYSKASCLIESSPFSLSLSLFSPQQEDFFHSTSFRVKITSSRSRGLLLCVLSRSLSSCVRGKTGGLRTPGSGTAREREREKREITECRSRHCTG